MSPRIRKILATNEHWPPRIIMIPQHSIAPVHLVATDKYVYMYQGLQFHAKKQRNCKNASIFILTCCHLPDGLWFKMLITDMDHSWLDWFTQWLGTQNLGDVGQYLSFAQKQRFQTILNGFYLFYFTRLVFSYICTNIILVFLRSILT